MKIVILAIITTLALTLAACSTSGNAQQFNGGTSTTGATVELQIAEKLAAGSFKLEQTDYSITKDEATQLLPLWQVYVQLTSSDTAAQEEITALTDQIQETMTSDQMKTINGFNMTQQDIFAVMQEQGIQSGTGRQQNGQSAGNGTQQFGNGNGSNRGQGGDGQFFFGGGGPGGGGFGGGQGLNPEQIATARAARQQNGGSTNFAARVTTPLVEALIKMLQQKAGL